MIYIQLFLSFFQISLFTDRNAGSGCGYTWIYHTILHYRDNHCKIVFKIPGNGYAAGNTWRNQTGGGRTDRFGGDFHFTDSVLGILRENGDIWYQLADGWDICGMCDLAQEGEDESNLGDGAGWGDESWRGDGLEDVNLV